MCVLSGVIFFLAVFSLGKFLLFLELFAKIRHYKRNRKFYLLSDSQGRSLRKIITGTPVQLYRYLIIIIT